MRSSAAAQLATGPAQAIGVPSMKRTSAAKQTETSGTQTTVSPPVCAGPTSISCTCARRPRAVLTLERLRRQGQLDLAPVEGRQLAAERAQRQARQAAEVERADQRDRQGADRRQHPAAALQRRSSSGVSSAISRFAVAPETIRAPARSWLPQTWSPSECVLTTISGDASTSARASSSMRRVRARSQSVSTRSTCSPEARSPAFDSPSPPLGCSQAQVSSPTR